MNEVRERDRRQQQLALIEMQVEAALHAVKLFREEETVERKPPQPEQRAALGIVRRAG